MISPITRQETPAGINFNCGGASFHSTDDMPGLGGDPLRTVLTNFSERDRPLHDDMLPERIAAKRLELFGGVVLPVAGEAIEVARRAKSDAITADARLMEPVRTVEPVVSIDHLNAARRLDTAGQARWVEAADLESLTSAVATGNRVPLQVPIYERARERYWLENWIARFNAAATNPAQPDLETVLATGPDPVAVQAEAEQYLAEHRTRMDRISEMEASAKHLIRFLAAAFDISAEEALDRSLGRYSDARAA